MEKSKNVGFVDLVNKNNIEYNNDTGYSEAMKNFVDYCVKFILIDVKPQHKKEVLKEIESHIRSHYACEIDKAKINLEEKIKDLENFKSEN